VLDWFRRLRKVSRKLSLPSRDAAGGRNQSQLNISKLTPEFESYVAQLSYMSLSVARLLEDSAKFAPSQELTQQQIAVATTYRNRQRELAGMLAKIGVDAIESMDDFVERIETFHSRTRGADWYENLISFYLAYGILEDLYESLAVGFPSSRRYQIVRLLADDQGFDFARQQLAAAISTDAKLASRLALWGRSIIADVLLEVRSTVDLSRVKIEIDSNPADQSAAARARAEFKFLEPLTGQLIATHTMRMDALGLSA
jgi:hypothetical protein